MKRLKITVQWPRLGRTSLVFMTGISLAATLAGCISTPSVQTNQQGNERATLGDLAASQETATLNTLAISESQRAAKLSAIYQQLLTLEPDLEVRTKLEYRLVQISTETFEEQAFGGPDGKGLATEQAALATLEKDDQALSQLIAEYQDLLRRFPLRQENEHIQYQLAKALDLQGNLDASLKQIESLLTRYPDTRYLVELNFRRGEIYYNQQNYSAAIDAYRQVIKAEDSANSSEKTQKDTYLVNSIYMSGWSQFKLGRFHLANQTFLQVFEAMMAAESSLPKPENFAFNKLDSRYQNLATDTQRVLSISLSQQQQSLSLVDLVTHSTAAYLPLYQHVLFENLAKFLLKKDLNHDAEKTYLAYITLAKDNIWSARFSLALLALYQNQGKFTAMHQLKRSFIDQYGLASNFWGQATPSQQQEILPQLLKFSDEQSRRLYARGQSMPSGAGRVQAFTAAASALKGYLDVARLAQQRDSKLLHKSLLADESLYADANFEALQYQQALVSYRSIAYGDQGQRSHDVNAPKLSTDDALLKRNAAYATTVTVRKILSNQVADHASNDITADNSSIHWHDQRNQLDRQFINYYPQDERAPALATHAAQYSFTAGDIDSLSEFKDFVLKAHNIHQDKFMHSQFKTQAQDLSATALKQVQVVSQLFAHSHYQAKRYQDAEHAYMLALGFVTSKIENNTAKRSRASIRQTRKEMRDRLASSIYFQAQALKETEPQLAIQALLRVGQVVPESEYRITAEFDAANLLLSQQMWQQAVDVLLAFQHNYPKHEYSKAIPAKLTQSYEALGHWQLAAEQLLQMVKQEQAPALKREAQYTAADYYLKAGNRDQALIAFRTYANGYPQPFDVAQEVRFKMSEFYRENKDAEKQYFWYRKILSFHQKQVKAAQQINQASPMGARQIDLASRAAFGLGQAHQLTFNQIRLKTPLQTSLKRKQKAMKQAIKYYQQVLELNLEQFVPQSTFYLAEMYRQLAEDVMQSQRPKNLDELALEEYDILLEELAYPFEEKAIEIHETNSQRAWQNIYDQWIAKSFAKLAEMSPAFYDKKERSHDVIQSMY